MSLENLSAYEIVERRHIADLNSESFILRHKKTGAKIALLSNDDENKVFYIGFRTTPVNSTGVAHILEHSVLCGSREFPVKDPFIELVKGSLNTFLNAMTFPDKTVYPVASCNDADFQNLMHVYLDAVFYPNIYKRDEIFRQEGWHYELESEEGELKLNGVVYNEMKGAFSSPDDVLERAIQNSLYPDTTYGFESGGDPVNIPDLSYEEFLQFHSKYYHPSNCYIYLYGDMDMEEKLRFIDEHYLSAFEDDKVDSEVTIQAPFEKTARIEMEYPIGDEEEESGNTYLTLNASIADTLDKELYVAFQIIDYALCSASGAPLKQALTDRGIGTENYSNYDNGIRQPYFSIVAKNCDAEQEQDFVGTIEEVLKKIVEEGFDRKALLAAINYYEFKYREADFGSYPKGLMYGLQVLDSWLYDDKKPFIHIEANATFEALKSKVDSGYFEGLIRKYLLENTHKTIVVLKPVKGLTAKRDKELAHKLAAYKASLGADELKKMVEDTKALKAFQESEDTPEDLAKIPLLSVEDLKKEADPFIYELRQMGDTRFLYHNVFTNGICYLRMLFDLKDVPADLFPYLGIYKSMLGLLSTEHYSYADLFNQIFIDTGALSTVINVYGDDNDEDKNIITLEVKTKVLEGNVDKAVELMREIILTSDYSDKKRVRELVAEAKSRVQGQMLGGGHVVALNRAMAYLSKNAAYSEVISGMDAYHLLDEIDKHFDAVYDDLKDKFERLAKVIFRPENLMVDFAGDEAMIPAVMAASENLKKVLYTEAVEKGTFVPEVSVKNEGFRTPGQIQYVARCGNFKHAGLSYTGALRVLKVMMGYDYLWTNVRVKGGAYGCMCSFSHSGECFFVSYRDPNLKETLEIYEKAADYIENMELSDREMTQYIIGAVSDMDVPRTPATKALIGLTAYMSNLTMEDVQQSRDETIGCTRDDLRKTAALIRAFVNEGCTCVVGNAEKINNNSELFGSVQNLI